MSFVRSRVVRPAVGAVDEAALVEAARDHASALIRQQVHRAEHPRRSRLARPHRQLVGDGGEDVRVVDELGEPEQLMRRPEALVELPVAVRRRPADELAVAEYAEEDDVLAAEIRRRARVEVPQLLPDRRDESGYVVVDPFGERAPRAEVAAALHRPNLDHAPALRGCTKGPSSSVLSAVKRSS